MKRLTKEQKKIIYIASVIIIFLFLFWNFVYAPQKRRLWDIKDKLTQREAEIEGIKRISHGQPLQDAVKDLNMRLRAASARLPASEEGIIKSLSEEAKKLKIDVQNTDPGEKKILPNKIPGFQIEELPISLDIVSEYKAIGEYLDILINQFPFLVRVRQFDIQGSGEGSPNLNVKLEISAYLSEK